MSSLVVLALRTVVAVMLVHLAATNLEFMSESHTSPYLFSADFYFILFYFTFTTSNLLLFYSHLSILLFFIICM